MSRRCVLLTSRAFSIIGTGFKLPQFASREFELPSAACHPAHNDGEFCGSAPMPLPKTCENWRVFWQWLRTRVDLLDS